jgi:transcription elongation GreA/GreB family factor
MISAKEKVFSLCLESVTTRIDSIRSLMAVTQASASEETKSSAGDKYETGRAMAQLEIEKLTAQLSEALKAKGTLEQINPALRSVSIHPGSIVLTTQGNFFISISAGPFQVDDKLYYPISAASPIGQILLGKKAGDSYSFRGKAATIIEVG